MRRRPAMSQTGQRVLVIGEEAQIRRFLRATLTAYGYRLDEVSSGQEGLAQAPRRTPDLIILDLDLPGQDGLEVAQRLREWSQTPIIALSDRSHEREKIAALDAGADDYLTKPFSI